ncbi:MAG: hypothetical protein KGI97_06250 [Alphaproteobacteria bacterium]|nr:hypothetical protein [Alphaproteobacteria bacterium]
MKKSLIIGAFGGYEWEQVVCWSNSIDRCGFTGDRAVFALNASYETVEKLEARGFRTLVFDRDDENRQYYHASAVKVHVERFRFIYEYLKDTWQDYDYVVTTDMRDVIFQSDPVAWLRDNLGGRQIVVSGEGLRIADEDWNRGNFIDTYGPALYELAKDREVNNVGVLGGTAEYMKDLAFNIFSAGVNRLAPITDQAVLNALIYTKPFSDVTLYTSQNSDWACQAGVSADPAKIEGYGPFLMHAPPVFEGGAVRNPSGQAYCIVHQYDRVPEWNRHFTEKFAN